MSSTVATAPRRRTFEFLSQGRQTCLAGLDFGDANRAVDVVFLHANGFNAMTYRSVFAPLAQDLRILAVDQRGHGLSTKAVTLEGRKDWSDLRDDALALLETLNGPPVVLSGHSLGGTVSLLAAAERPARIKALALFDPVFVKPEVRAAALAGELIHNDLAAGAERRRTVFDSREAVFASYHGRGPFKSFPDAALRDYIADGFRDRPDGTVELSCTPAWEASGFRVHGHDSWAAMRRVLMPVTILRAERGSTCSVETPAQFNPDNPRVRVETIPGTSHFLPIERPDLVAQTLKEMAAV
jgi:pimeloyl-ACP methyl ester carboxylesterase